MSEYGYDADQPGGVEQQSAPEDTTEYTVIIDIGESTTKVGLAGDDPVIFPTIVGKPKYKNLRRPANSGCCKSYARYIDTNRLETNIPFEPPVYKGKSYLACQFSKATGFLGHQ